MSNITYHIDEDDHDPSYITAWAIIRPYFEPGATISQAEIVAQLAADLPDNADGKLDYVMVFTLIQDLAAKTPYDHPCLAKLADLTTAIIAANKWKYPLEYYGLSLVDHAAPPTEAGFVSEQAYHALVSDRTDKERPIEYAFHTIVAALEYKTKASENEMKAAALWLLNYGSVIHHGCFDPKYDVEERITFGESLYEAALENRQPSLVRAIVQHLRAVMGRGTAPASTGKQKGPILTPQRWQFWKQGFDDMAAACNRFTGVSDETKTLAARAAAKMDELCSQDMPEPASMTSSMLETKP